MKTRREFIKQASALTTLTMMAQWAAAKPANDKLGTILPQRKLTRDGQMVTAFSLGGWHAGMTDDPMKGQALLERAMELGVRFYDNARWYNKGRSEEYMGRFLTPKYRDYIFLMTKSPARDAKTVREQLDESLKALNTDYLDLWQVHSVNSPEDTDKRINQGVIDVFLEAKASGKVRYIGFTGHCNPEAHLDFMKKMDDRGIQFDTCQMPLNICDASQFSFQNEVLPILIEKEIGVIAMKTMAGGSMMGKRIDTTSKDIKTEDIPNLLSSGEITAADLHRYVYSLPISSLCSGCCTIEELEANVKVLTELKKMSVADIKRLEDLARPYANLTVENYKRDPHAPPKKKTVEQKKS